MDQSGRRWFYREIVPFAAMVSAECTNVAVNTLFKSASSKGMSFYVFVVYSYAFASLSVLPAALFLLRRAAVPSSPKLPLVLRICVLALLGSLAQIIGFDGIKFSSPTLSSAMGNLIPAFTFLFAVILRMEKVSISKASSVAKIVGTIVSIAGALVIVLYKGPTLLTETPNSDWLIGGLLLATQYLLFSLWYILQTEIMKMWGSEIILTFIYTLFVAIISAPICFVAEKNLDSWLLKPDISLVSVLFNAIFGPCYSTLIHSWGLKLKGPLYIAMFKPLAIAISAFMGIVFLGEALHLGVIIGAIVISAGFYAVVWAKAEEEISNSASKTTPLLQSV